MNYNVFGGTLNHALSIFAATYDVVPPPAARETTSPSRCAFDSGPTLIKLLRGSRLID